MAFLSEHLENSLHRCPIVCLGSGRLGLVDKFIAILHALGLEAALTMDSWVSFVKEIAVGTSDLGVEFGLNCCKDTPLSSLLPHFHVSRPVGAAVDDVVDLDPGEEPLAEEPSVSFENMLSAPGILHIMHNLSNDLLKATPQLDAAIDQLVHVAKHIRNPPSRERMLATCFGSVVGRCFHKRFRKYKSKVNKGRWGTVAFSLSETTDDEIKRPMRRFWNLALYIDDGKFKKDSILEGIDESINSVRWWSLLETGDLLYKLIRDIFIWVETCPCHGHLDLASVDAATAELWRRCPLRSLRFGEVCNGDIFDMFHRLSNMTAANILMRLPEDAPECVKTECIAEFEKGRIHIFFGLTLKLGCFLVPPLRIGAATHHHREASVAAIRICLDAEPNHYRLRQLQSEPVLSEALAYIQGEELQNLPMLQMYIAELRFAFSAERYVEGGHAVVYKHGGHARNRCESYDSLHLRVCEIERCMDSDPNFLIELADILLEARSPEKLTAMLGLGSHPSARLSKSGWDPIWRKIVYRADPFSMYKAPRPQVDIQHPPAPPRPPDAAPPPEPAPDAPSASRAQNLASGLYRTLRREAALQFLHAQMSTVEPGGESDFMYTCSISDALASPVHSLLSMLTDRNTEATVHFTDMMMPSSGRHMAEMSVALGDAAPDSTAARNYICFSVVSATPQKYHLGAPGSFEAGDLAIALHDVVEVGELHETTGSTPTLEVMSTPTTIDRAPMDVEGYSAIALVLTPSSFDLETLQGLRRWKVNRKSNMSIGERSMGISNGAVVWTSVLLARFANNQGKTYFGESSAEAPWALEVTAALQARGFVERLESEPGVQRWALTALGSSQIRHHDLLFDSQKVLNPRDVPHKDMYIHELWELLERDGWVCNLALSKSHRTAAKNNPYKYGETKTWWLSSRTHSISSMSYRYMACLLTAMTHQQPVPHFDSEKNYRKILEPGWDPGARRSHLKVQEATEAEQMEDWMRIFEAPRPQRRRRGKGRGKGRGAGRGASRRLPWGSDSEVGSDDKPSDNSDSSSDNCKGTDPSSSSSSTSSSSSSAPSSAGAARPKAAAKASSSGVEGGPPSRKRTIDGSFRRNKYTADPWGLCRITPRWRNGKEVSAQITCGNPAHHGCQQCSKEISFNKAGGREMGLRFLKSWAIFGMAFDSRGEHLDPDFIMNMESMLHSNNLPTMEELDAMCPIVLSDDVVAPLSETAIVIDEDMAVEPAEEGVPEEVHARMERLMRDGDIPCTTRAGRKRCRKSLNTILHYPPEMHDAVTYGYVHPNLPPPRGQQWKARGGQWHLKPRGG